MNWIKNYVRPKIRSLLGQKRDTPENMWIKDPESGQMVFYRDLEANHVCVSRLRPPSPHACGCAPEIHF